MKKILIITSDFSPIKSPRSFRITELAIELSKQGNEVSVITHRKEEFHKDFEENHNIKIEDIGKKYFTTDTNYVNNVFSFLRKGVRKVLNIFFEYPDIQLMFLSFNVLKNKSGYDLLISNAWPFPIHWGTAFAYKKFNIAKVWVADCGDPYMKNENLRFKKPFYFDFFEKLFLKNADYVTVPFESMIRFFDKKYKFKFKVIPQGVNFSEFNIFSGNINNPVPTFIYSGTFYTKKREPFELIDYLEKNNKDYKLIFYIDSDKLLNKYSNIIGERIIIRNYIPRSELVYELSKADFLINIDTAKSGDGIINAIPSKLIDYSISGRPIYSYENGKFDAEKFEEFFNGNYRNKFTLNNFEDYRIENVGKKFLSLLN